MWRLWGDDRVGRLREAERVFEGQCLWHLCACWRSVSRKITTYVAVCGAQGGDEGVGVGRRAARWELVWGGGGNVTVQHQFLLE